MPTPPTYSGTIKKLDSDPVKAVSLQVDPPPAPPVSFAPLTDAQWVLLCSTPDGKTVTITAPGPGTTPTNVSRP